METVESGAQELDAPVEVGGHIWLNGQLTPTEHAHVSVLDHGLIVGDGTFESIPVVRSQPFAITRHLRRLRRTCEALDIPLGSTDEELKSAMSLVLAVNAGRADHIRLTVTAGQSTMGSARVLSEPTVLIGSTSRIARGATANVVIAPWCRNDRGRTTGLKTISYIENVLAIKHANDNAASEVLLANTKGELCEGGGSNVFVVIKGELVTPPLSAGCLPGVTRELILESTGATERAIPMEQLASATEGFLTASTRGVQPLGRIDNQRLDAPGPMTVSAQQAFWALEQRSLDP